MSSALAGCHDEQHAHEGHRPVRADGDRRGTVATDPRALFDHEFKIHVGKLAQICKIAVGQFGALAVAGCAVAKGTKLDLTTIYPSSVIGPEQIMKVTNSAPGKLFKGLVGADSG